MFNGCVVISWLGLIPAVRVPFEMTLWMHSRSHARHAAARKTRRFAGRQGSRPLVAVSTRAPKEGRALAATVTAPHPPVHPAILFLLAVAHRARAPRFLWAGGKGFEACTKGLERCW